MSLTNIRERSCGPARANEWALATRRGTWRTALPGSPCPADVNLDGVVNIDDIFVILAAWGTCEACPEDVNNDGFVDIDDVFVVLGNWGPCQ